MVISSLGLRRIRLDALGRAGFADTDIARLRSSLRTLTANLLNGPLWTQDLRSVHMLRDRPSAGVSAAALLSRLRDCVEHGTVPFAGLARAAFVATELLDDLVAEEVLSEDERSRFIGGLGLITGELRHDLHPNPLDDAETFRLGEAGLLAGIGGRPTSMSEIQGQYLGLLKFTPAAWSVTRDVLATEDAAAGLDMTGLLAVLLRQRRLAIGATPVVGPWCEFDHPTDLEVGLDAADAFDDQTPGGGAT